MRTLLVRYLPAALRYLAGLIFTTYAIAETATWSRDGLAGLRGPLLCSIAVTLILGWAPLLIEGRVRCAIQQEHDRLILALEERDDARADGCEAPRS